jgi:hypothetical protein
MRPCLEEGEEEEASLLLMEEVVVEGEAQMLLKVKIGDLVRATTTTTELAYLPVRSNYQSGWSL